MHGLVKQVESAIELEEVVQLRHKVQCDSPRAGSECREVGFRVGRARTTEGGRWASIGDRVCRP
jgi:hypothetical protein